MRSPRRSSRAPALTRPGGSLVVCNRRREDMSSRLNRPSRQVLRIAQGIDRAEQLTQPAQATEPLAHNVLMEVRALHQGTGQSRARLAARGILDSGGVSAGSSVLNRSFQKESTTGLGPRVPRHLPTPGRRPPRPSAARSRPRQWRLTRPSPDRCETPFRRGRWPPRLRLLLRRRPRDHHPLGSFRSSPGPHHPATRFA